MHTQMRHVHDCILALHLRSCERVCVCACVWGGHIMHMTYTTHASVYDNKKYALTVYVYTSNCAEENTLLTRRDTQNAK